MTKETPQHVRVSGQAPSLAADVGLNVVEGVRCEVREAAVLEVAPQQFHRVEVWRVGRKPDDVAARMSGQPLPHERVLVRAPAIPDQDERTAHMAREMAKKAHHLRTANVHARVQSQRQGDLSPTRRHDQGADPGDLLVRARTYGEQGRGAARRPRTAEYRQHQEAGFIEADQVGAETPEFFLPWPSPPESTRAPADHRAPWPAAAAAAG